MGKANSPNDGAKSEKVPEAMQARFDSIVALTDAFCTTHLNDEYAQLSRKLAATLARKRPSPLGSGQPKTWACGIVHTLGFINFLFDSSQSLHLKASEIYQGFGVSQSTGGAKSKQIRDLLDIDQLSTQWLLPSKIDSHPLTIVIQQMITQEMITADTNPSNYQELSSHPINAHPITDPKPQTEQLIYVFEVYLQSGPVSAQFIAKNPEISRVIDIKGNSTLADLHQMIFDAYDRYEQHMYKFFIGGEHEADPKTKHYVLSCMIDMEHNLGNQEKGIPVETTTIACLDLEIEQRFGYLFDFGDDWFHVLELIATHPPGPDQKYPQISKRVGKSPPQYRKR